MAMTNTELLAAGVCEWCHERTTAHGPWSPAEISEICLDLGVDESEFGDACDPCFVRFIAFGDVAYAQTLVGERLLDLDPPVYQPIQPLAERSL